MPDDYADLERALGYRFSDRAWLIRALTHRSYANEHEEDIPDNERLEFLGDAVVGLAVADDLMDRLAGAYEGELSVLRAQLVSETGLADAARRLELGPWLRLGRGEEQTGGRDKKSILADTFEAMCGAVYRDAGFEVACKLVTEWLAPWLATAHEGPRFDFKTRLQEFSQSRLKATPRYEVLATSGPDHDKRFDVRVVIDGDERGRAEGRSKKAAEQGAAEQALAVLTADE